MKGVTTASTCILDLVSLLLLNCDDKFLREEKETVAIYLPVQPGSGQCTRVNEWALSKGGGDNPMAVQAGCYCLECSIMPFVPSHRCLN